MWNVTQSSSFAGHIHQMASNRTLLTTWQITYVSMYLSCLYLAFGGGQLEPNSCTCIPKKHTSMPSISSNAKIALAMYGKLSDISGLLPSGPGIQNLAFMPGRTSTTFSELDSTLMVTSPAPASLRLRNKLTRFSRYVPSFVWGKPAYINHRSRSKVRTLATAHCLRVRLQNSSTSQSVKWQLIGIMQPSIAHTNYRLDMALDTLLVIPETIFPANH